MYKRIEENQQAVAKVRWSTAWTTDKSTHPCRQEPNRDKKTLGPY